MQRDDKTTIYVNIKSNVSLNKIFNRLKKTYYRDKYIKILKPNAFISTNDVINTNYCHISICKSKIKNKIIILSAIDNLIKGGAGQAVQNLNMIYDIKNDIK